MGKEIHKAENRRNPKTGFSAARPKQPLEPQLLKPIGSLHDDDDYKDCLMEHGVLSGKAQHVSLTRVKLQGMRFDAALPSLELEDVLFEGCDLSNAVFSDSFLLRVAFLPDDRCRLERSHPEGYRVQSQRPAICQFSIFAVETSLVRWMQLLRSGF